MSSMPDSKQEGSLAEITQDGVTYTKGSYVLIKTTVPGEERGVARLEQLLHGDGEASAELRLLRRPTDLQDVRVAPGEEPAPNELVLSDDLRRVPLSKLDGLAAVSRFKHDKDAPYVCFRRFDPSTRSLSTEDHPLGRYPPTVSDLIGPPSGSASGATPKSTPSSATPPTSSSQPPASASTSVPAKTTARKRDPPAAAKKTRNAKRTRTVSTANVASASAGFGLAHSAAPSSDRMLVLPKDLRSRWSRERYEAAQRSLMDVLVRMGAISPAQALARPKLREEARKLVGDTGLLDHLLRHMPEACVISGLLVRRMQDQRGHMVYWAEIADPSKRTAGVLPLPPAAPQPRAEGGMSASRNAPRDAPGRRVESAVYEAPARPPCGVQTSDGTMSGLPTQFEGDERNLQALMSLLHQAGEMPPPLPMSLPCMSSPQQQQVPTSPLPPRLFPAGAGTEERISSLEQRLQEFERGCITVIAALEQHLAAVTARLDEVSQQQLALSAALARLLQTQLAPGSTGQSNVDLLSALTAASGPPHPT